MNEIFLELLKFIIFIEVKISLKLFIIFEKIGFWRVY